MRTNAAHGQRYLLDALEAHCSRSSARLHWAVINSIGFRPDDTLCAPVALGIFHAVAQSQGIRITRHREEASVVVLDHPLENELLSMVGKIKNPKRVIAYNDEAEIDGLPLKSFDKSTACFFDQQAHKVVRIFDGHPPRISEYLHLELGELTDSALAIHAQRIASLR